ncbi:MAG TPA: sugar ABC transporter substrate-binding protein [Acetobacteraceae bacterium]|nr:sugar ABC transporter substrate-binding protein [Acetobacteraceae bacterium]
MMKPNLPRGLTRAALAAATVMGLSGAAQAKQLTFALSSVGLSYPFASAIAKGFREAGDKVGARTIVLDARGEVQKQANDIQDLITEKVDGIVIMPLDSTVAVRWVDHAAAAGIPVVSVGSEIGDPNKRPIKDVYPKLVALATQDEVAAGEAAGRVAATLLPKGKVAKIAVIEGKAGFPEVQQRREGFENALKAAGAKYDIVASQPGDWTAEKGESACQNILQSNPGVDLFFAESDDMVVGCARAVRDAGSDAKLIGMGGSKLAISAIKSGEVTATVCYKPENLGALAFDALYDDVTGKKVRKAAFLTYDTPAVTRANVSECVPQW